jgi:hypothetical protein
VKAPVINKGGRGRTGRVPGVHGRRKSASSVARTPTGARGRIFTRVLSSANIIARLLEIVILITGVHLYKV